MLKTAITFTFTDVILKVASSDFDTPFPPPPRLSILFCRGILACTQTLGPLARRRKRNFFKEVCHPKFQYDTVGWTSFGENDTLGYTDFYIKSAMNWRFLDKTCQNFAFFGFWPNVKRRVWFLYRNYRNLTFLLTKIANRHTLAQTKIE